MGEMTLKHYIEYSYLGQDSIEKSVEEIAERDVKKFEVPEGCLGFRFFDKTVKVINGEAHEVGITNVSGYFFKGEKLDYEQLKKECGNTSLYRDTIRDLVRNGYTAVVKTNFGKFFPMKKEDTII